MQRLRWFALFSLLGIGGLFAVRTVAGVTAVDNLASDAVAADVTGVEQEPPAKGDRLRSPFLDGALLRTLVDTVKITHTEEPKQSEAPKDEVATWHWHERSKIVRHGGQS
jgi:hypothetical protein